MQFVGASGHPGADAQIEAWQAYYWDIIAAWKTSCSLGIGEVGSWKAAQVSGAVAA
jgi:hypothetical protein